MSTIQATPNRSVHMPNVSPHIWGSSDSVMLPLSTRPSHA
jgi:hypothetical protein